MLLLMAHQFGQPTFKEEQYLGADIRYSYPRGIQTSKSRSKKFGFTGKVLTGSVV